MEEEKYPIFIPELTECICTKVYDGDTIHIAGFMLPRSPVDQRYRWTVRLRGVDAPEIHGPDHDIAIKVRDELAAWILHKPVELKKVAYDKYGRLLADVYCENQSKNECVSEWLMNQKLAREYYGGKKK